MHRHPESHTHTPASGGAESCPVLSRSLTGERSRRTHHITLLTSSAWWPPRTFLTLARRTNNKGESKLMSSPPSQPQQCQPGGSWGGELRHLPETQQRQQSPPCLCTHEDPGRGRRCGSVLAGPQRPEGCQGSSCRTPQAHLPSLLWVLPCLGSP